jgi:hypothetical protein
MATKKRQQTINKRNRERAIEEKRTLKRQAKEEKREAIKSGEIEKPDWLGPPNEQLGPGDTPAAPPPEPSA